MSGTDERFERALGGDPPSSADDRLGAFVRDVRDAFPAEPMLAEEVQVQAIADAARRVSPETRPPMRKERPVGFPKLRSRAAMLVAGFVVVMSSFGGLAVAGALPGGVQNSAANAVATIGVDLPGGDDESPEVNDDATETEAPEADDVEAPEKDETFAPEADDQGQDEQSGDQGDDHESEADDQGQDEQSGDQGDDQESEADDQGQDEQSGDQGGSEDHSADDDSGEGGESGDD